MNKNSSFKTLILLLISVVTYAQSPAYYISQEIGSDSNDGLTATTPFKTLANVPKRVSADASAPSLIDNDGVAFEIILMGTFINDGYYSDTANKIKHTFTSGQINAPFLWNSENTLIFSNFEGEAGKYITIRAHNSSTILNGNGSNILRVQNSKYLIFKDLVIKGEVESIPLSLANELQFAYLNLSLNENYLADGTTLDTSDDIDRYNPTLAQIRQRDEDDCVVANCADGTENAGTLYKINDKKQARPSYVDTRGFYLSGIKNIQILNNTITQMPGGGLRVSDAEDVDIIGNDISHSSKRSFSGTHGLVVTKATSSRTGDDYRIRILRNKIHHNYNEQYSWAPDKDKITPHIDEGKGISLQRNRTTYEDDGTTIKVDWENGRILVANNIAYYNGFSGIHSNDGDRVDFISNTAYFNSYTKSVTEDTGTTPPTSNNGGNIGISMSDGQDCKIINNISVIDSRLKKSAISVKQNTRATSTVTATQIANGEPYAEVKNNLIYGTTYGGTIGSINEGQATTDIDVNTIKLDPQFVDPTNFDFRLKITSPAIDRTSITSTTGGLEIADTSSNAPTTDYNEDPRYGVPDLGALEFDANVTLWDGSESASWSDADNWSAGVPLNDNTYAINIPTGAANYPEITTAGVSLKDVYVNAGGTLNIAPTGSLTVTRDLTQEGTFKIKSDDTNNGSFILKGDSKGTANVDYDRYVTTNWHLVSSPIIDQNISAFAGLLTKKGNKYPLAAYNNSLADDLRYTYYTDGGANPITSAGNFIIGKGYSIKKTTAGVLTFSGTLRTDATPAVITDGTSATVGSNKWNIVGNPSTAFINLNDDADINNNFLTVNATKLDPLRIAIYMWNGTGYDILNHSGTVAHYAAPGQAFFIQSKNGGETINFTEDMQSHQTGKSFFKSLNTNPEIDLFITTNGVTKKTQIRYQKNTTTGLDLGYDAGTFSATPSNFDVYTHLVSNSEGHNIALQCLPNSGYERMVIPVGVTAVKDTNITFSSKTLNLPAGIKLFIEDKTTGTYSQLDESGSEYTVQLDTDLNGIGRFYIHTTSSALNVNTLDLQNVSIYTTNRNTLQIAGLQDGKSDIKMYDLVGKQVFSSKFEAKGLNTLNLPNLKTGVYVINLQSEKGNISKKIVLK
ncbi:T9SS type A sorting domain-containing protein [Polaribacter haliotis]|uniref:T9SS type A sorting domain-containing protein n=1 Tax=Polaribacter haliotis TaxID=1888915 RepID=A0A7L8AI91_9FLAO|nr:T9SS type A sorting domain-containing protein [Polaribacter haliotis]QOD61736.1 T9SS type A sorting domain-containing protein [Polaribacter haliotis]